MQKIKPFLWFNDDAEGAVNHLCFYLQEVQDYKRCVFMATPGQGRRERS
jgi:predicted 3-demethylubiquinone-9 3-methyltransferase (glyoxalase superfamily)